MRDSPISRRVDSAAAGRRPFWLSGLDAAIFVTCALAVALLLEQFMDTRHVRMVFLAPVIASAARDGWLAASFATLLSVLAIGYFVEDSAWPPTADAAGAGPYALFVLIAATATFAIHRGRVRQRDRAPAATPKAEAFRLAMLSSLGHDFKAPLGAILGSISSLRLYGALYDEPARNEMLATAQAEVERLNRYLGNLLDITRLDADALPKRMEPIDIADVIGAALKRAEPLAKLHRIATSVPADLPMVPLDFMLAEQALYNLIENAANYAPAQTEILIKAKKTPGAVKVTVEDQGPGIAPEFLEQVFAPFYRIPRETPRAGIGLGLPVARGFIEAMGGTLTADNRPAGGARFLIELPVQQPAKS